MTCTEVIYKDDRMRSGRTDELRKNLQQCTTAGIKQSATIMALFYWICVACGFSGHNGLMAMISEQFHALDLQSCAIYPISSHLNRSVDDIEYHQMIMKVGR